MKTKIFILIFCCFTLSFNVLANDFNPVEVDETYFADENGRYLIITHDIFYDAILPLAQWKHQKGLEVEVAKISEIGSTPNQIKGFILNAYQNWEVPPEFVLIVGDHEYINVAIEETFTDNFYADMEGDFRAELFVGRFTCTTIEECQLMVTKTMSYEFPNLDVNPNWMNSATLLIDDDEDDSDEVYYEDTWYAYDLMEEAGYANIDTLFRINNISEDALENSVNAGTSIINFRGSCGGDWPFTFDVETNELQNRNMLPIVMSATCITGNFVDGFYECEQWMKAGTADNPIGGVAFYGTSTSGVGVHHVRSAVDQGFFGAIYEDGQHALGQACVSAKDHLVDIFPWNIGEYKGWNLLGDPALSIWTGAPGQLSIVAPDTIYEGQIDVTISVLDEEDGSPVENALVCAVKGLEIYTYGYTNSDGEIDFSFNPNYPSNIYLTVTSSNYFPASDSIWVNGQWPYVTYQSHIFDDEQGNGNGIINPGEEIDLYVTMYNGGLQEAQGVTAALVIEDEFIQVISDDVNYPNIPPFSEATNEVPFQFIVNENCPDGHEITFYFVVFDENSHLWLSYSPPVSIGGGNVNYLGYDVDDAIGGDGDNILEAGEEANLIFQFQNIGGAHLSDVEISLTSTDSEIEIIDGQVEFSDILAGESFQNTDDPFVVQVQDGIYFGGAIPAELHITGYGDTFTYQDTINVTIGILSPIILVDDDQGEEFETLYIDLLTQLDLAPLYWNVEEQGSPNFDVLNDYEAVIWFTGNSNANTLTEEDQANLTSYLDEGGNLLMIGCLIGSDIGETVFYEDYLHAYSPQPVSDIYIDGINKSPIGNRLYLERMTNALNAEGFGRGINTDKVLTYRFSGNLGSCVAHSGDHRTVYWGFGLESLQESENNLKLLKRSLAYFDLISAREFDWKYTALDDESGDKILDTGETCDLTLSITNHYFNAYGVSATLYSDDPDVEIIQSEAYFGDFNIDEIAANETPFTISIAQDSEPHFANLSLEIFAETAHRDTLNFQILLGKGHVLLIDDDGGAEYESYYLDPLAELGLTVHHFDARAMGSPPLSLLESYPIVIWFTGDKSEDTLTEQDQVNLSQFLDSGGNLFLTAQNIGDDIGQTEFYSDYLHSQLIDTTWTNPQGLAGTEGDPISHGMRAFITGDGGANNQVSPDQIAPLADGHEIFSYQVLGSAGAVGYDGDYKMVYFSFGFEGVNQTAPIFVTPVELMTSVLEYLEIDEVDISDDNFVENIPEKVTLHQNYPNPFNPSTTIQIEIPEAGQVDLRIYDISGRLVKTLLTDEKEAGYHNIIWDGTDEKGNTVNSGVYLYRIVAGNFNKINKCLLVK